MTFVVEREQNYCFPRMLLFYCLSSLSPPSLALLLVFKDSSASSRFLTRPSHLFLPLQYKRCVKGLCFRPTPSQHIYDVPAVWAISQGLGCSLGQGS